LETKKTDLVNLSHFEKEKVLEKAKTLLQQQKEEVKICRTLERYSQESEGYSLPACASLGFSNNIIAESVN
jgi:hypothetical protein